jgi:hypothetical protein
MSISADSTLPELRQAKDLTLGATGELFGLVFFDLLKIFMPRHPISGMKGSKPRTTDGDAQSTARRNFEFNSVLDRNYKRHRNRLLDLKTKHEALAPLPASGTN